MRLGTRLINTKKSTSDINSSGNLIKVDFSFADSSPKTIDVLSPGDFIKDVYLEILDVFPASSQLTIGFPADNDEIMKANENKSNKAGVYHVSPFRETTVLENLNLYLSGPLGTGTGCDRDWETYR